MNGIDQWYYLDGSETRGPVPAAQIAQLIQGGSLSSATQVAQAGWQTWSPASVALSHLLQQAAPKQPAPQPANEPPTYAIKVQCIAGPDMGKAYMISAAEVSLGRISGLGAADAQVADNHVVLSWQNNVLYFRTFAGSKLRVADTDVTQGTLSNGQKFQMGASTWQVGNAPVELTNLLSNLGARLNKLTSTDKLEGFSLTTMFSEVFKGRQQGELESYFTVGTSKTTPPLGEVQTGWPKPWFFMRVLLFMLGVYVILYESFDFTQNSRLLPGIMVMGAMAAPLATAFLVWELNTPRNISFHFVLMLVCLGGVASLFVSLIGFDVANLGFLGAAQAGIVEESGKLLAVILVARGARYKWTLNGLVFGAAIGAGFAAFETAGYAFSDGFFDNFVPYLVNHFDPKMSSKDFSNTLGTALALGYNGVFDQIHSRSYFAPFTHPIWTAISAGALWRVKGGDKFSFRMLLDPSFMRVFMIPVLLHMTWNSPLLRFSGMLGYIKPWGLGIIAWYVAFLLIQQGLRQIREAQLSETRTEIQRTRDILTTTGKFRSQTVQ